MNNCSIAQHHEEEAEEDEEEENQLVMIEDVHKTSPFLFAYDRWHTFNPVFFVHSFFSPSAPLISALSLSISSSLTFHPFFCQATN